MEELKDLKILLAEDNWINQRIATLTFKQLGVSIDIASNGQEALEKYRENNYDLIMMDLQMPVMDGLESARQIRTFEEESRSGHKVYIVALTANMSPEIEEECIGAGMDDFMEKPFQESHLRTLLSKKFK
ncbi:MAG TPA: response regulator [Prolixibacteraceae bacterium]|jgi:CheY-like chemotaxis protein|nr:response regulator [Prolixibacteraceae bacterium]